MSYGSGEQVCRQILYVGRMLAEMGLQDDSTRAATVLFADSLRQLSSGCQALFGTAAFLG